MIKTNSIFKFFYPINLIFNKFLPNVKILRRLHSFLLDLVNRAAFFQINKNFLSEIQKLQNNKKKRAILVWDCKTSPVTYGDFVDFCIFARYLKSIDLKIKLYITNDKFRHDWNKTYPSLNEKNFFLGEIFDVGRYILDEDCIEICDFYSIDFISNDAYIPFYDAIISRSDFQVFKYAEVMTETIYNIKPSKKFLISTTNTENLIEEVNYISWHIRGTSINSPEMDETPEDIIAYYKIITSITNLPIVVISSKSSLKIIKRILGNRSNLIYSKDRFDNFLSDIKIIHRSKLYIQCGWGGAFTLAVSSDVPFLGPPIERVQAPWQMLKEHVKYKSQIRPWEAKNQSTFNGFADFKSKLLKISKEVL